MLYPFYFLCCSVCFVCCVFGETYLNFHVMEMLNVGGGALLDRPCMVFQRMYVCVVPVIPVCI